MKEVFLVDIILQIFVAKTSAAVVVSQQSLASLREQEEDHEAGSQKTATAREKIFLKIKRRKYLSY